MKKLAGIAIAAILALMPVVPPPAAFAYGSASSSPAKLQLLEEAGIFQGFEDGSPHLEDPMTREQFATVVTRLWKLPTSQTGGYRDVDSGRWSADAIGAVTKAGIMDGVGPGLFAPEAEVTFEQLAAMLVRAFGYNTTDGGNPRLVLGKSSDWAKPYVRTAISFGLLPPQADYTVMASRSDLVDASYISFMQLVAKGKAALPPGYGGSVGSGGSSGGNGDPGQGSAGTVGNGGGSPNGGSGQSPSGGPGGSLGGSAGGGSTGNGSSGNGSSSGSGSDEGSVAGSAGEDIPPHPLPELISVTPLSNAKLTAVFQDQIDAIYKMDFTLTDSDSRDVPLQAVTLNADGKSAIITTDAQVSGQTYKLEIGESSQTYTALPIDYIRPYIAMVNANPDTSVTLTFSEAIDPETAVGKEHYTISGLDVRFAELSADNKQITMYTTAQKEGQLYFVTASGVKDWSGNAIQQRSGQYFTGKTDEKQPEFLAVAYVDDTHLKLIFDERLDPDSAQNPANYSITGGDGLAVAKAELGEDRKSVVLAVTRQIEGALYMVKARSVQDLNGNAMAETVNYILGHRDTSPPAILSLFSEPGSLVKLTFSEAIEPDSAADPNRYTIDHGLVVRHADVSKDGKIVILTTDPQTMGVLYQLKVKGIRDLVGNEMAESSELTFAGNPDLEAPRVDQTKLLTDGIRLTFSEKLDPDTAVDTGRYELSGGGQGTIEKASYDEYRKTVTLTTSSLAPSGNYTLKMNVTDLAGNKLSPDSVTFTAPDPLRLNSATAVTANTIDLTFNRPLKESEWPLIQATITKVNNVPYTVAGISTTVSKSSDPSKARVRFQSFAYGSIALFQPTLSYEVTVSGPAELVTDNGAAAAVFKGSSATTITGPYITDIRSGPGATVNIRFSEPVKNVTASEFSVTDPNGTGIPVMGDRLNDPERTVTETTLYLGGTLIAGKVYSLGIAPGMTDASGLAALQPPPDTMTSGGRVVLGNRAVPFTMVFGGNDSENETPKLVAATSTDKWNLILYFSEPVTGSAAGPYTLINTSDTSVVSIVPNVNAVLVPSKDLTTVAIHLNAESTPGLVSGVLYKLVYDRAKGSIQDLQRTGTAVKEEDNEVLMAGNGSDLGRPSLVSVINQGNSVTYLFDRDVVFTGSDSSLFVLRVDGQPVTPEGSTSDARSVTLTYPSLPSGHPAAASIAISGVASVKDMNGRTPDTGKTYSFTIR